MSTGRYGCYVGNIDSTISLDMLKQIFSQCGNIIDASLNGKETDPYRYGFIDFSTEVERERAFKLDGVKFANRCLKVSISKGNVGKPNGFSGGMMPGMMHGGPPQFGAPYGGGMPAPYGGMSGPPMVNPQVGMLMQMIQSGAVNPQNLTPEQQQMLAAHALASAPPPMSYAPRGGGGFGGRGGGGFQGGRFPSPNPVPTEETLKLREIQRKQYFDQVRKQGEKYERKLQEKVAQSSRRSNSSSSSSSRSSAGSADAERDEKRQRTETL